MRWLHIFIFAEANEHVDTATAVRVLARTALPAPLLLIGAAFFDGTAQALIWIVALSIDFGGPFVFGVRGFRVSAGHFAERFGLIVIIALGESIVAIGAGIAGVELDTGLVVAAVFGVALSAALWWAYFDMTALLSEEHFRHLQGEERLLVARDAYSYLHLPLIAGILLVALGVKKTLGHVDEPLKTVPAVALFGGIALYYAANVAFRLRIAHTLSAERLVAAASASRSSPSRRRSTRLRPLASQPARRAPDRLRVGASRGPAPPRSRTGGPWVARGAAARFTACSPASGSTCLGSGAWVGPSPSAHARVPPGAWATMRRAGSDEWWAGDRTMASCMTCWGGRAATSSCPPRCYAS